MTPLDAADLAHRALVAASVLGLRRATPGLRVTVADLSAAPPEASADVLVVVDERQGALAEVPPSMARLRAALGAGDDGVLALVVGSPITRALASAADANLVTAMAGREDTHARALVWAAGRVSAVRLAPPLDPERLGVIVEAAAASGLTLVEPEIAAASPALARMRGLRSPRARALAAIVGLGACARPLLFVPSNAAPKGGLARTKVERLADGWVAATKASRPSAAPTDLVTAALAVLRDGHGPMPFKELLREARERWASSARDAGARANPSSADVRDLATGLYRLAATDEVLLFALDPLQPAWELEVLST